MRIFYPSIIYKCIRTKLVSADGFPISVITSYVLVAIKNYPPSRHHYPDHAIPSVIGDGIGTNFYLTLSLDGKSF